MPFTPKFVDLVRNFTTVQGTGPVTPGAAVNGYAGIADALSAGDQFYYCIQGVDRPQEREVGRGTLQADGKITRQAVSGSLTSFSNGTKTIALVAAAEWFSKLEQGGAGGGSVDVANVTALAARTVPTTTPAVLAQAGREGLFLFMPANLSAQVASDPHQGIYIAPQSDPSGASGAWVRQVDGGHNVKWFGAAGDNVSDDGPAFAAAIDYLKANLKGLFGGISGSAELFVPAGTYYLGTTTLDIAHTMKIRGESRYGTTLRWAHGATGIRMQAYNTEGAGGVSSPTHYSAGSTVVCDLTMYGGYAGTEGEFHGIHGRTGIIIERVSIYRFSGDGLHIEATAGGGVGIEGNANCFYINQVFAQGNRHGLFVNGADANAGTVIAFNGNSNRCWGIWDSSFLGNTYIACHAAANGWDGAIDSIPTGCTYLGNRYYVRSGQAAGASTNAPTGTAADNIWWGYHGVGGTYNGVVAWASGTIFREGGAYKTDDLNAANLFLGCYSEGDQNPSQMVDPSQVLGGLHGAGLVGVAPFSNNGSFPRVESGYKTGTNDGYLYVNYTNSFGTLTFRSWNAGVARVDGEIVTVNGPMRYWSRTDQHTFMGTSGTSCSVTASGIELPAGKVVKVDGNQVVGSRGAAVADATDAASAITQLNALLARLRGHGLIAS